MFDTWKIVSVNLCNNEYSSDWLAGQTSFEEKQNKKPQYHHKQYFVEAIW